MEQNKPEYHVVSLSGGKDSTAMLLMMLEKGMPVDDILFWRYRLVRLVGAFFFGLVLASTWFVGKDIKEWNKKTIPAFIIGVAVAYYITVATPAETPSNLFFIFLCGAIDFAAYWHIG